MGLKWVCALTIVQYFEPKGVGVRTFLCFFVVLFSASCAIEQEPPVEIMDSLPLLCDVDTPSYFSQSDRVSTNHIASLAGSPDTAYNIYRGRLLYLAADQWFTCKGYEENPDMAFIGFILHLAPCSHATCGKMGRLGARDQHFAPSSRLSDSLS